MNPDIMSHWILSRRLRRSFGYAAYITIFGLLVVFITTVLSMTIYRDVETFRVPTLVGLLFILLVAVLFAASLYFWLGMMLFLLKFDRRSVLSKCALFPLFLLGTTLTATIYYFLVYREIGRQADQPSPAL
jgi:amino acid transporter